MGGFLGFDPNRKLEFETGRPLDFNPGRSLEFQPSRELEFNPNRDLGFGHRGIVFRGYICPICGALVSPDAPSCNECGTVFEGGLETPAAPPETPPPPAPPPAKKPPAAPARPPAAAPKRSPPPQAGIAYCPYCGVQLRAGVSFCWNCGARTGSGGERVTLPNRKSEPVTREWKGSQER